VIKRRVIIRRIPVPVRARGSSGTKIVNNSIINVRGRVSKSRSYSSSGENNYSQDSISNVSQRGGIVESLEDSAEDQVIVP